MHTLKKPDILENCFDCTFKTMLFRFLAKDELALMNKDRFVMQFKAGELIYKQGSPYTHVISITTGLVKLYIEEGNRTVITRFIRPTDFIGGPGMYVDNKNHNSAAAVEDSTLCYINVDNFKSIVRRNGLFAEELMKGVSSKGLTAFERLMSLSVKQMPGLVADVLIFFSEQIYKNTTFNLTVSRQEIADYCGLTKESVIRTLKDFKDEGLIILDGNYLKILNPEALKRICKTG
jgi:CRP/FNR family transcriptional regulator, polysaccharide utilization system transcription regulator